jgi:putative membrane protein
MSPGTELALDRTFLAHERTLMAWIRTSTSLISFGFSIYKFFQYLVETGVAARPGRLLGPREFAIGMISVGVVALGLAVIEHRRDYRLLEATYGKRHQSLASKLALIVLVMGFVFLIAVLLRK